MPALEVGQLLESALRGSGREDFANRAFVPALKRLIDACRQEANLSRLGILALRHDVLRCLGNLLCFDELETRFPAVLTAPVRAPVFITGMPRSGTTFLHRLVVQDPHTIAPRLYHLVHPDVAHAGRAAAFLRKTSVRLQLALFRLIAPEFHALHPLGVDEPEECTDIMAQVFHSSRFESSYRVPSYGAWLHASGFLDAYRFHRRFLRHLQVHCPERRWILKSPDHVFGLDEMRAVYPDARRRSAGRLPRHGPMAPADSPHCRPMTARSCTCTIAGSSRTHSRPSMPSIDTAASNCPKRRGTGWPAGSTGRLRAALPGDTISRFSA
jgi:Sulfotransferase family